MTADGFVREYGLVQFNPKLSSKIPINHATCEICSIKRGEISRKDIRGLGSEHKVHRLAIDHCHKHGWVRGWVCDTCNNRLKIFDNLAVKCPDCGTGEFHHCVHLMFQYSQTLWHRLGIVDYASHLTKCPDCSELVLRIVNKRFEVKTRVIRLVRYRYYTGHLTVIKRQIYRMGLRRIPKIVWPYDSWLFYRASRGVRPINTTQFRWSCFNPTVRKIDLVREQCIWEKHSRKFGL